MSKLLNMKAIEHFVVVLVVAFASEITIAGAPVDLSSAAGRSAVVTAIVLALWRALRVDAPQNTGS